MASFDSTIGFNRDDLSFEAKFYPLYFSLGVLPPNKDNDHYIPADKVVVHVSTKDQLHALRAALYAALADSYAQEGEALTVLPALTGNALADANPNEAGMLAHIDSLTDEVTSLNKLVEDMMFECEGDFSPDILFRANATVAR